jgi:hypothetical protein
MGTAVKFYDVKMTSRMIQRPSMCGECAFRGKDTATRIAMASAVTEFPCHLSLDPQVQCKGHSCARRITSQNPKKVRQ